MPSNKLGVMGASGSAGGGGVSGELWMWGADGAGRLGVGTAYATKTSPVQVGALDTWTQVFVSSKNTTFATQSDGTLWAWGRNNFGSLGHGDVIYKSSPVQSGVDTDWGDAKLAGHWDVGAIKSDGTLWTWGRDSNGSLGRGTKDVRLSTPTQLGSDTDWYKISNDGGQFLALKTDGTLWGWGLNQFGQLGTGTVINFSSPVQIGASTDWVEIQTGLNFSGAIKSDGTLWTWGASPWGQNGRGNLISISSPVQVGALTDWSLLTGQGYNMAAIKTDGTIWAWGKGNPGGGVGDGFSINRSSPVQLGALTDWYFVNMGVGSGSGRGIAMKTDSTVWVWGDGQGYGLGLSDLIRRSSPVQLGALDTWVQVSGGDGSMGGIKTP